MGSFVDMKARDGFSVPAYVAQPAGRPHGGVVVLQEIFGVNAHIRNVADAYASQGYLAVAPATFQRVKPGVDLGYGEEDRNQGMALKAAVQALPAPGVLQDIQSAIDHAAQAGKVGIVGFCWGGLLAWQAACELQGLSAGVAYYGGGTTTPEEIKRRPRVPVLAHYADQDRWISQDSVEAFRKAHPEVQIHVYHADHGFNCDHRGAYDEQAASLARERTLAFLAEHLA